MFSGSIRVWRILIFSLAGFVPLVALQAQESYPTPYNFKIFAGQWQLTGSTDGSISEARFTFPEGVAVDNLGNIYVADWLNSTIRKITTNPTTGDAIGVVTFAGVAGSRDLVDGVGSVARFNRAVGVAADGLGNVYVADTGNNMIRKISAAGSVTSLAGVPGSVGAADGAGTAAQFNGPSGVAVDASGNVYVADQGNHTIRKISINAGTGAISVTTLAGAAGSRGSTDGRGSDARFNYPRGLAMDAGGNVYVADQSNCTIRKITINAVTGEVVVSTLAGSASVYGANDGIGSAAQFNNPSGVAVDGSGNVFVADSFNRSIRRISPTGRVTTVAGTVASGGTGGFGDPRNVAVDALGHVFVSDRVESDIQRGVAAVLTPIVSGYGVGKKQDFLQSSSAVPASHVILGDPDGAFHFSADLEGSNLHVISPAPKVTAPNSSIYSLAGDSLSMGSVSNFSSKAALDAAFANGLYNFTAGSANFSISLGTSDAYPAEIPRITNGVWDTQGALTILAPTGATLNFNNFSNYSTGVGGIISFNLYAVSGSVVGAELIGVQSSYVNGATSGAVLSSYTIAAGTLQADQTYYGELSFARIANLDIQTYPRVGIGTFLSTTGFMISTGTPTSAPIFTLQPVSQNLTAGASVTLTATATGNPVPTFQWRKNGVNIGGANSGSFTINNLLLTDAGSYTVVATNSAGSTTSNVAVITVSEGTNPPIISNQSPTRNVKIVGQSLNLDVTVIVTGSPSYQWFRDGRPIAGATQSSYSKAKVSPRDNGWYQVAVTNAYGTTRSAPMFVAVAPAQVQARSWGYHSEAELKVPAGLVNPVSVSAGTFHMLALQSNGQVVAWGDNVLGQSTVPSDLANVVAVSAGYRHSLALRSDGTVVAWGDYSRGQSSIPAGLTGVVAISAGYRHSLALRSNGTVVAWGDNAYGQIDVPTNLTGVVAIATGSRFSLALKSDGTVLSWGETALAGMVISGDLSDVTAIAAGSYHAMALKSNGTVVALGTCYYYSIDVPFGLTTVTAISAGGGQTLALKADGSIVGWGNNESGQLVAPSDVGNTAFLVSGGGSATLGLFDGNPLPVITTQPLSQAAFVGSSATISAVASSLTAVTYQWQKNGISIPGATSATLALSNVQLSDAGSYSLIVTNVAGSVISRFARFVVLVSQQNAITYATTRSSTGVTAGGIVNFDYFVTNVGTKTWGAHHYLSIRDVNNTFVAFSSLLGILPGETTTANLNFPAPTTPGTYTYYVQGLEDGVEFFSTQTTVVLTVLAPVTNAITYNTTSFPVSAAPGSNVIFTYNVTNTGTTTWDANHILSLKNGSGTVISSTPLTVLVPGASKTVNLSFTVPSTPGTYNYTVQASQAGVGNFGTQANLALVALAPQPNAIVYNRVRYPAQVVPGAVLNLKYTLSNAGTQEWGGGHYVSLRDSNESYLSFIPLSGTAAGGTKTVEFTLTAPTTPGTYTYYVQALEDGIEFFSTQDVVIVKVVALPLGNAISYNTSTIPVTASPSSTVNFTANVTNRGTRTWGATHYLSFRDVDNTFLAFPSLNGVAPGSSRTSNLSFTAPTTPGIYTYTLQAFEDGVSFFEMADTVVLLVQ